MMTTAYDTVKRCHEKGDGKMKVPPLTKGRSGGVVSLDAIIDYDPTTKTDPLNPDTDGSGLKDGEEDVNKNGRVDGGKRDPLNPEDDTYPSELVGSASAGCGMMGGMRSTPWGSLLFGVLVLFIIIRGKGHVMRK